jgi:hypothetical protein
MKLIMTPKQARSKVLSLKKELKTISDILNNEADITKKLGMVGKVVELQVKLDWAVSDYKLALQKKNATI